MMAIAVNSVSMDFCRSPAVTRRTKNQDVVVNEMLDSVLLQDHLPFFNSSNKA